MNFDKFRYSIIQKFAALTAAMFLISIAPLNVFAAPATTEEALADAEERKLLPVESNRIENWPAGPAIGAQSAILLEANTGVVLYAKNIDEKLYPASTTKLMTCLIAA